MGTDACHECATNSTRALLAARGHSLTLSTQEFEFYSRGMTAYFSDWRSRNWSCAECAWTGDGDSAAKELFSELFELNCPKCSSRLDLIVLPTRADIRNAAENAHPEAVRESRRLGLTE